MEGNGSRNCLVLLGSRLGPMTLTSHIQLMARYSLIYSLMSKRLAGMGIRRWLSALGRPMGELA